MSSYVFLLLILACPLAMFFMMRGMSGGMSRGQDGDANTDQMRSEQRTTGSGLSSSVDELRRRREQLDREIEEREAADQSSTPVGGGWR